MGADWVFSKLPKNIYILHNKLRMTNYENPVCPRVLIGTLLHLTGKSQYQDHFLILLQTL